MGLTEVGVANEKIPPNISNLQHSSAALSEKPRHNANAKNSSVACGLWTFVF